LEKALPTSTVETDSNTITVTFPSAQSGYARLIEGGSQVTASIGYTIGDISSATYDSKVYNTGGSTNSLHFKQDGTMFWVINQSAHNVNQYSLSTAWDISTSSNDAVSFDLTNESANSMGVVISTDGTKMYILDNDRNLYQYTLGTAWNITTAVYDNASVLFNEALQLMDFTITDEGTALYMVSAQTDKVYQYALGTAWDINTLVYNSKNISAGASNGTLRDIIITPDGSQMMVIDDSDFESEKTWLYDLGTNFDVTTAILNSTFEYTFSVYPAVIALNDDGTKMYIGDLASDIYQYSTNI